LLVVVVVGAIIIVHCCYLSRGGDGFDFFLVEKKRRTLHFPDERFTAAVEIMMMHNLSSRMCVCIRLLARSRHVVGVTNIVFPAGVGGG